MASWHIFSIIACLSIYIVLPIPKVFHVLTLYKYYNLNKYHQNWMLETLFYLSMGIFLVFMGISFYSIHGIETDGKYLTMVLMFSGAVAYFFLGCTLYFTKDKYKKFILLRKNSKIIRSSVLDHIDNNKTWWNWASQLLDLLSSRKISIEDNIIFPFIIIENNEKYKFDTGIGPKPKYIKQHPYYPEFKRKLEEIPLEDILKRIKTFSYVEYKNNYFKKKP